AQLHLQMLLGRNNNFNQAERRLIGLIKYRVHPEERVRELAQTLGARAWDDNLRQDLIDYTWLFDKLRAQQKEEERLRQQAAEAKSETPRPTTSREEDERYQAIERGDLISIVLYIRKPDGEMDY